VAETGGGYDTVSSINIKDPSTLASKHMYANRMHEMREGNATRLPHVLPCMADKSRVHPPTLLGSPTAQNLPDQVSHSRVHDINSMLGSLTCAGLGRHSRFKGRKGKRIAPLNSSHCRPKASAENDFSNPQVLRSGQVYWATQKVELTAGISDHQG
jgi:hypothetical protein